MLRLPCECYECLRMLTNGLAKVANGLLNDASVLPTLSLPCHFLTAVIGIITERIWRWAYCFLEFKSLSTPCKCLTNVANASECLTNGTNGLRMLTNIDGEWRHSQHSLKFRRRLVDIRKQVSRWRMTCERSEFVTNAYKYSASVANFERMSNIFIRKHIH